jgi:hypothetical protein
MIGLDQPQEVQDGEQRDHVSSRCRCCQWQPSRRIMPRVEVIASGIRSSHHEPNRDVRTLDDVRE